MSAPDPKILAAALVLAEEGLQVFRGIDDPEIKKEVVLNEAILAAAKAYQPMREALEEARAELFSWCGEGSGSQPVLDFIDAALNPAGPA
jgi:hypothetical protein